MFPLRALDVRRAHKRSARQRPFGLPLGHVRQVEDGGEKDLLGSAKPGATLEREIGIVHATLPEAAGDLIAVMTAGAYGAVQAGTYNTRLLVPEVLVNGEAFAVVRPRTSYADLIGLDKLPPWLA